MKDEKSRSLLKAVGVFHEGVPGHRNQSLGITEQLQEMTGCISKEFEVPNFRGLERIRRVKGRLKKLPQLESEELSKWLTRAGGDLILNEVRCWLEEAKILPQEVLLISAGSRTAPYLLAVSRILGCQSAVLMTPKYLGTAPFDFGIIPSHDFMEERANELVTLGAPNRINRDEIKSMGEVLLKEFPSQGDRRWAILIGGENSTFRIPPTWVEKSLSPILNRAQEEKVEIYLATSRRTRGETEQAIQQLCKKYSNVRLVWLASEHKENPVPGLLGLAERVFCTEDSISMVSESLTAGKPVTLLQTEYIRGPKKTLKHWGLKLGFLSSRSAWKPDKFATLYNEFQSKGWLQEDEKKDCDVEIQFNEAKRAAHWIIDNWR